MLEGLARADRDRAADALVLDEARVEEVDGVFHHSPARDSSSV